MSESTSRRRVGGRATARARATVSVGTLRGSGGSAACGDERLSAASRVEASEERWDEQCEDRNDEPRCEHFDDANTEVLAPHRVQAHVRLPQPRNEVGKRHVQHEVDVGAEPESFCFAAQCSDARLVVCIPAGS